MWLRALPRWCPVVALALLLIGCAGMEPLADAWVSCRDRVFAGLEEAGQREFGDASAYFGATGAGALAEAIERCGYHAEQIDRSLCDDLFAQVYAACRESGFAGMSMAASSWVAIFDPQGPLVKRLQQVCVQLAAVSREEFGRRVCGESAGRSS